ncbi:MAG: hypothetical protein EPO22_11985 [Dehalococcoidia bacterium]|nr:MAG: hypothetical protein EPO22_11985 [Dehalococcoidia bacterium]
MKRLAYLPSSFAAMTGAVDALCEHAYRDSPEASIMRRRRFVIIALVAVGLFGAVPACGGAAKEQQSAVPGDLLAAWSTAAKAAVDNLRIEHLAGRPGAIDLEFPDHRLSPHPVKLDAAAELASTICRSALDDLKGVRVRADALQRGCETALRAASTPRISAPAIYEQAFAAFADAGSLLSLADASDASQARIARVLLEPYDPASFPPNAPRTDSPSQDAVADRTVMSGREYLGDGLKGVCSILAFDPSAVAPCQDLVAELQDDPYRPDPTAMSSDWSLLQGIWRR